MHRQNDRYRGDQPDRGKCGQRIVSQVPVQRGIDGERRRRRQQQRVAVWIRTRDRLGTDIAAGAAAVLDVK